MKLILLVTLIAFAQLSFAQWTTITPPPSDFRTDHSYGFALNGVGYLVAGTNDFDGETSSNFYSYNPTTDAWTQLPDFPGGTRGYAIGDVYNGKAYFGFGTGDSPGQNGTQRSDLWEFDPSTQQWTELAACPGVARIHPAFVTHQGVIYVGLGGNETLGNLKDWWAYDIASDSWSQKTNFPSFERHHPYQFAAGEYVYVGFGHGNAGAQIYKNLYRYNPANDSWTQVADIPAEGRVAGAQFSHNGYGYILSGDGGNHTSMPIGEFWRYDGNTDTWQQLPSHPGQSRWAPASFVLNDEVYLINGSITPAYTYPNTSYKFNLNSLSVGVEEELMNTISIYPNPFTKELNINLEELSTTENLRARVYNSVGQLFYSAEISKANSTLNLSTLENGIYFVQVYSGSDRLVSKRVVKN